jgi:hypothetical protein
MGGEQMQPKGTVENDNSLQSYYREETKKQETALLST